MRSALIGTAAMLTRGALSEDAHSFDTEAPREVPMDENPEHYETHEPVTVWERLGGEGEQNIN